MRRSNSLFILTFLLFLLSSFLFLQDFVFEKEYQINLQDGENFKLGELIYHEPKLIGDKAQLNSGIIKSFDTDLIDSKDIISYINMISLERVFGYFSVTPGRFGGTYNHYIPTTSRIYSLYDKHGGSYGYHNYSDEFKSYYHKLFNNKMTRKLLFDFALDFLVDRCKAWPKDFTYKVIDYLDELLVSSPKIANLSQEEFESKIIGNKKYNYLHGFIYRRIKTDNVPLSEILNYINIAKQTINDLDVKSNPDYKFGIQVNNHVMIHVGADNQFSIQSNLNSKILKISDYLGEDYYVSEITYLAGDDGDFYQITFKSGLRDTQIHLYDTKLNLIY